MLNAKCYCLGLLLEVLFVLAKGKFVYMEAAQQHATRRSFDGDLVAFIIYFLFRKNIM